VLTEARSRGAVTLLVTHFGFTKGESEQGYKNHYASGSKPEYFGANPRYEEFLSKVDYLIVGHTHAKFDGIAQNGHTRVINVGSDYEAPKFQILEV
jgi:predicted phosphodiesterase